VSPTTVQSLTPTVSLRRVKSSVSVANGQTVLLAGLISEQQNNARTGFPCLIRFRVWATPSLIRTTR